MGALLCLAQLVAGAAHHDVLLVDDVVVEDLLQREDARHAVDQRQVDDAEAGLQLGVLVELLQHDLGLLAALEVDDDAHALAVGLVVEAGDLCDLFLLDELGDLLDEAQLVDLVGDLGHDDALLAAGALLDMRLGAHGDRAAAGLVGVADAGNAHDGAAGGEVRAGNDLHQLVELDVGVVDHRDGGVDGLAQVVGRHVGGHAHGDALGAVDQQVGEAAGQDLGLLERLVVVGLPVDGLLLEVLEQLHGGLVEAALRVAHGCGGVAVDGAEVAVAVHQGHAHGEVLRQAHEGGVDGGVAMGVVLTHAVAHGAGGLHMRLVGGAAALVHRVEDAAVHGLEAVAHVGQGAGRDDGHGVLQEAGLHLLAEVGLGHLAHVDVERAHRAVDLVLELVCLDHMLGSLIQAGEQIVLVCHVLSPF